MSVSRDDDVLRALQRCVPPEGITTSDLARRLGAPPKSLADNLRRLTRLKKLIRSGIGPATRYRINSEA